MSPWTPIVVEVDTNEVHGRQPGRHAVTVFLSLVEHSPLFVEEPPRVFEFLDDFFRRILEAHRVCRVFGVVRPFSGRLLPVLDNPCVTEQPRIFGFVQPLMPELHIRFDLFVLFLF